MICKLQNKRIIDIIAILRNYEYFHSLLKNKILSFEEIILIPHQKSSIFNSFRVLQILLNYQKENII